MNRRVPKNVALGLLMGVSLLIGIAGQKTAGDRLYFDGADRFVYPVRISHSVARSLRNDSEYGNCSDRPYETAVNDWFSATKVRIGRAATPAVLVKGTCANSGDTFFFWLFAPRGKTYRRIFFTSTLGLYLGRVRNGYREILAEGGTASGLFYKQYTYNGQRYVKRREWWHNLAAK